MSKCNLIKNGFYFEAGNIGTTYCCEGVMPGIKHREHFQLKDWNKKREYELAEYEKSKQGWLPSCLICKYREDLGRDSMRIGAMQGDYEISEDDFSIRKAVIKTDNKCNIACRMCGPGASSKWVSNLNNNSPSPCFSGNSVNKEMTETDFEYMKKYIFTDKFRFLLFSGGETMLSKWATKILKYLIDNNLCKNMKCHFTTNGTIEFKDEWHTALNNFKECTVEYSIDGSGDVFNYIRAGHSWDKLIEIKDKLAAKHTKADIECNYVAQMLNAHSHNTDQENITEFFSNMQLNKLQVSVLHQPVELSYRALCNKLREKYNINHLINDMDYDPEQFKKFMRNMAWQDMVHKTNLKEHNPDFFNTRYYAQELIDEYYYKEFKPYV
jgi:organic radical activating enzyme